VNGTQSKVVFSKDGGLGGDGLKKTVDPAIDEMFGSIGIDLMAHRGPPRITDRVYDQYRCGGFWMQHGGLTVRANSWLSKSS
jgi:hypothetical protein